jgi:aminopeptidase N
MTSNIVTAGALPVEPGVALELARYRAANVTNINYRLYFDVPDDAESPIDANLRVSFKLASNKQPLQLDFREDSGLLASVSCNGMAIEIDHRDEHLVIPVRALTVGANTLEIAFTAGNSSLNRNPDYLYTLFVPDRARTAFPLFDQPDLKATFDLTLDLPSDWRALANAPVAASEAINGKRRHVFSTSEAISSYLFAFVAGRFEAVTSEVDGRSMTLLHRETDSEKVARNLDAIFAQHARAISWMENYTGIDYPFSKLDFALIPGFPYGGMEHVGAIFYRARNLLLEENATDQQYLNRATLIAHEAAHMWFGNLVTMAWFDDVWTKEVFANFMAAKIVNPEFPEIDHQLSFLVDHYPPAYQIDRSAGANPIRQELPNLAEAGQMYGSIIYHKAPIMMRQLELMLGEPVFREGMQEYLNSYAGSNVTWPELISILDSKTKADLKAWSDVWVNTPGRPEFQLHHTETGLVQLRQEDLSGSARVWPQQFGVKPVTGPDSPVLTLRSTTPSTPWPASLPGDTAKVLFNADGMGYGHFPASLQLTDKWGELEDLQKGALLIDLNENMLARRTPQPLEYLDALLGLLDVEDNSLVLDLLLEHTAYVHQTLLPAERQAVVGPRLESLLWQRLGEETDDGRARQFFDAFTALATSPTMLERSYALWSGKEVLPQVKLSESDRIRLAEILAIRLPGRAEKILAAQLAQTSNPDERRRLAFVAPSLSADKGERDAFFASLADEKKRQTESWVVDALGYLHHPSRTDQSVEYLRSTLDMLEDIQRTGDIFFPMSWLQASWQNHNSERAVAIVTDFLDTHPVYSEQLRMKILQATDRPMRAAAILGLQTSTE